VHFAFWRFVFAILFWRMPRKREREVGMRKVKEERVCDALAC
jgi:hypothetical protein